jgi:hypothetical protein
MLATNMASKQKPNSALEPTRTAIRCVWIRPVTLGGKDVETIVC